MHPRILIATGVVLIALAISALVLFTGGKSSSEVPDMQPVSLNGTWRDKNMVAEVTPGQIVVKWSDDEGAAALYWKGSFTSTTVINDTVMISDGDTEAMAGALLASMDAHKTFTYLDGTLQFQVTIMGTTKTAKLSR